MTKKTQKKQPPKRSPPMVHCIDISRHGEFSAQLVLKTQYGMKEALSVFKLTIGTWLEDTEDGREAWIDTCGDFNYGDYALYDDNPVLKKMLRKAGIVSAQIMQFAAENLGEHWDVILYPTEGVAK